MAETDLKEGDVIASRFRIVEPIGSGGMGAVYRAVQQPLGRDVAIKVLHSSSKNRDEMVGRFEEEAKAIASLRHPGIVTLYDFGSLSQGGLFLAMELVRGQSLRERMYEVGRMSVDDATSIICAIGHALAEAHRKGVIHRDLKPANVMVCDDPNSCAKLVDFGLSCRAQAADAQHHTTTGVVMGTPGFIAPEMATSGLQRDPRADLYALGVMWFEMLTGGPPFEAETPFSLVLKHANEPVPAPRQIAPDAQIPDEVEELILRLMAKSPEERPADAVELVDWLDGLNLGKCEPLGGDESTAKTLQISPSEQMATLSDSDLLHRTDKPVVVVLPFDNLSSDPSQEFFGDGITEDLITALSKFRSLNVIARQTSFALKEEKLSSESLRDELEATYALEGSVRKAGDKVRISARLVDLHRDHQLWGQRYDRTLEDIFAVQDEVTQAIVAAIPRQLQEADMQRIRRKTSDNMAAYELLLAGRRCHHLGTAEYNARGIEYLEQAVELDPNYAQAWAWLACIYGQAAIRGYMDDEQKAYEGAITAIEKAYELDDQDSECHRLMCELRLLQQRWEQAKFHHDRALSLNPNDPMVIAQRGFVMLCLGTPEEGLRWIDEARRLDPMHPTGYHDHLGRLYFAAGRYEEAVEAFRKLADPAPKNLAFLAGSLARLDRLEEAEELAAELRREGTFTAEVHAEMIPYRFTADKEHHVKSLEMAGL